MMKLSSPVNSLDRLKKNESVEDEKKSIYLKFFLTLETSKGHKYIENNFLFHIYTYM